MPKIKSHKQNLKQQQFFLDITNPDIGWRKSNILSTKCKKKLETK